MRATSSLVYLAIVLVIREAGDMSRFNINMLDILLFLNLEDHIFLSDQSGFFFCFLFFNFFLMTLRLVFGEELYMSLLDPLSCSTLPPALSRKAYPHGPTFNRDALQ